MRRSGLVIFLVGCSSTSAAPDASIECEYVALVSWSAQATPEVTAVTVDGHSVPSGVTYSIDEVYPSYEDAMAGFRTRPVVVTTTSGTLMFELTPEGCPTYMFEAPIIQENDQFYVQASLRQPVDFTSESGSCKSNDGRQIAWIP